MTPDTSHSPITPCGQSEQSPFGDLLRNSATSSLSCSFDEILKSDVDIANAGRVLVHTSLDAGRLLAHTSLDIDPDESANIPVFIAVEWTQLAPQRLCLKDLEFRNMSFMLPTLATSHFEMSPLNDVAP